MKEAICTWVGILGSLLAAAFGGWDSALMALVVCMAVDYISGSLVALVFHNSQKSEPGAYNSTDGLKGLCQKCLMSVMQSASASAAMRCCLLWRIWVLREFLCPRLW